MNFLWCVDGSGSDMVGIYMLWEWLLGLLKFVGS